MKDELTERQEEILEFLSDYHAGHGWMPTIREIGDGIGLGASSTHRQLKKLESMGYIERASGSWRAMRLVETA